MTRALGGGLRTGAAYAAASQVVGAVGIAVTNVIVARSLGPEGTGQFNVLVTLILFATVFAPVGLDFGITYYVGGGRWAPGQATRRAQLFGVASSPVAVALLWLVSTNVGAIHGHLASGTVLVALASIPFAVSWTLLAAVALAITDYRTYALAPVIQAAGMALFATTGAILFDVAGAAAGLALANACAAALTGRRLRRNAAVRHGDGGGGMVLRAIRYGLPVTISNGLGVVSRRIDLVVVSAVVGATQAGPYAIALAISSMQVMLPRGLAAVVLPRVARETSGPATASDVFGRSSRHAVIISVATGLAVLAGAPLIPLVYGPGFQPALELTLILIPGSVAYGIAAVLTAGIVGQGRSTFPLISALVTAPPTVAAYIVGAEAFGATGTAVASSASYAVTGVIAAAYAVRVARVPASELFAPRREDWHAYAQLLGTIRRGLPRRA